MALFADMVAIIWFRSPDRVFTWTELCLLPLNDSLVTGADCGCGGTLLRGTLRELAFISGDPTDRTEPFAPLVVRRLLSPPLSLFFLNLAINPLKVGPELEGVGAGETGGSIVTVAVDRTDIDPLCSVPDMETSPG